MSSVMVKIVEQEMIVAEMRSADMPVEVLGLHVEREHVGEQRIQRTDDVLARIVAQIGGGGDGRLAAVLCSRFLGHRESLFLSLTTGAFTRASSKMGNARCESQARALARSRQTAKGTEP